MITNFSSNHSPRLPWLLVGVALALAMDGSVRAELGELTTSASTTAAGHSPLGARDGDRFTTGADRTWRGQVGEKTWWWEAKFAEPTAIGALLQITGDHDFVLRDAPRTAMSGRCPTMTSIGATCRRRA